MGFLGWGSLGPGPTLSELAPAAGPIKPFAPSSTPTPTTPGPLLGACTKNASSLTFFSHPGLFLSSRFSWTGAAPLDAVLGKILKYLSFTCKGHLSDWSVLFQALWLQGPQTQGASRECSLPSGTAGPRLGRVPTWFHSLLMAP